MKQVARLIDGKKIANDILEELSLQKLQRTPGLAVILVGNRPDSAKYVQSKRSACKKVGIDTSKSVNLPNTSNLMETIHKLNQDDSVDGILLQLPLPDRTDQEKYLNAISFEKDVDGLHAHNLGMLCRLGEIQRSGTTQVPYFNPPCTPAGVMELLTRSKVDLVGKNCVILGRSTIVGLPLSLMLSHADATVTICHSKTKNIAEVAHSADVLISAIGKANIVKKSWVKPGAVVIDVGINFVNNKLCGDVDFEEVKQVAGMITPVPGGVGPMTIAMLMKNTIRNSIARNSTKSEKVERVTM